MSRLSARLFNHVQGAAFYTGLHRQAVELLPPGGGRRWFDVGCGPGLVTRLAAERGYRATGFDVDPAMIAQARRNAPSVQFVLAGLAELAHSGRKADVVSAASLLAVLGDRPKALQHLLSCLTDDGVLLVIEPSGRMTPTAAWAALSRGNLGARASMLMPWAWTRREGNAVEEATLRLRGHHTRGTELLDGMVVAWTVQKATPVAPLGRDLQTSIGRESHHQPHLTA